MDNPNSTMTIGERICRARQAAGMTQQALADKLGIPYQSISQWEKGKRNPKIETLINIANAIGCKPIELMADDFTNSEKLSLALATRDAKLAAEATGEDERIISFPQDEQIESELLLYFRRLNDEGKETAVERVKELNEILRYRIQPFQP